MHGGFRTPDMPGKMLTKLGVMIPIRIGLPVLFPKYLPGYTRAGEFLLEIIKMSNVIYQKDVWVGTPQMTNLKVDGHYYYSGYPICPGNHWLSVTPVGGNPGNAEWTVPPGIPYIVGTNMLDFTFPSNLSGISISARSTNSCGTSTNANFYLSKKTYGCSLGITLYPNPASVNVTIAINNNHDMIEISDTSNSIAITNDIESTTYTIRVLDSQGILLSTFIRSGTSFTIPLDNLHDGIYIIEATDNKNSCQEQLIIKH